MLGNENAVANVAVKDVDVATDFYRNTLGLKPVHQEGKELVVFQSGGSSINVYRSEYAGTNKATAVTWTVDNVEEEAKALKNRGVVFEHYDMPGMTRHGDVHVGGRIEAPTKLVHVNPIYPPIPLAARKEGLVILEALIGEDGTVRDVKVLRRAPLFEESAIAAVRQWRFSPTLLNGEPVPVVMTVTVGFTLER